jgi:hypothetical protein
MKTCLLQSKKILFLSVFSAVILVSCEKPELNGPKKTIDPQAGLASLKDSASYTIDGKLYTCDITNGFGSSNDKANRDSNTGRWDADTVMYSSEKILGKQRDEDSSNDGAINVMFIKKYAKSQLIPSSSVPTLLQPKSIVDHYKLGKYRYALDYQIDNKQNGVALSVRKINVNELETLKSQPVTMAPNSQDNATFEITRFDAVGDGSYLLEAKFTANVYGANQTPVRVDKGYLRFRVR